LELLAKLGIHSPVALHGKYGTYLGVTKVAYKGYNILVSLDVHPKNRPSVLLILVCDALYRAANILHILSW
jgi:hypothetical protein